MRQFNKAAILAVGLLVLAAEGEIVAAEENSGNQSNMLSFANEVVEDHAEEDLLITLTSSSMKNRVVYISGKMENKGTIPYSAITIKGQILGGSDVLGEVTSLVEEKTLYPEETVSFEISFDQLENMTNFVAVLDAYTLGEVEETPADTTSISLSGLSDALGDFMEAVKKRDAETAAQIYSQGIISDQIKSDEVAEKLYDYLHEMLDAYAVGEGDGVKFGLLLDTAQSIEDKVKVLGEDLEWMQHLYQVLSNSKENYKKGMKAYEECDYEEAVCTLSNIDSIDEEHYEEVQDIYQECRQLFEVYLANEVNDYLIMDMAESANAVMSNIRSKYLDGNFYDSYFEAQDQLIADTLQYYVDNDFAEAKVYYATLTDYEWLEMESVEVIYQKGLLDYKKEVISSIRDSMDKDEFVMASDLLDEAFDIIGEDSELLALKESFDSQNADYSKRAGKVSLVDLNPYKTMYGVGAKKENDQDIFGTIYSATLYSNEKDGSMTYRIDGNYKNFSGVFYVKLAENLYTGPRPVSIYGDGKELFSAMVDGGQDSVNFSIDVVGVKDLTINMNGDLSYSTRLGNPILTGKDYKE